MELSGTNAILTGASRGLGVYIAEALANSGVNLALAARDAEGLERTAEGVRAKGVKVATIPTDVGDEAALRSLAEQAEGQLGPIDILINNAGIEHYIDFHTADTKLIEKIMRVNILGPQVLTRFVLPGMIERRRGHIVNIASVAGKTAVPYNVVYSSSKHALVGFSWSLREEVKPLGVGVSVVCPGFVSESGMFADWSRGKQPPGLTRSVSPDKVAAATIKAIEDDKAEIIVASGLTKVIDVLHALSPGFTTSVARKSGAYGFLAYGKEAEFKG